MLLSVELEYPGISFYCIILMPILEFDLPKNRVIA